MIRMYEADKCTVGPDDKCSVQLLVKQEGQPTGTIDLGNIKRGLTACSGEVPRALQPRHSQCLFILYEIYWLLISWQVVAICFAGQHQLRQASVRP